MCVCLNSRGLAPGGLWTVHDVLNEMMIHRFSTGLQVTMVTVRSLRNHEKRRDQVISCRYILNMTNSREGFGS